MKAYNKEVMTNPKVIKDNKKAMIKIANLGLDKENIKRRNAFLDEADYCTSASSINFIPKIYK